MKEGIYEYEPLFLTETPISVRRIAGHTSNGRVHWHEAIELLYFTQGKAVTSCNLQEENVQKGDIVFINGNELHTGIVSQINSVFYCIHFDTHFLHNLVGTEYILFQNIIRDDDCKKLLDELLKRSTEHGYKSLIECKKLACELFALFSERYVKAVLQKSDYKKQFKRLDTFHQVMDYLEKHYTEDLSVSSLAKHFMMSPSYFAHFFKKYSQKSVIECVNDIRILHAKGLLEKTELSIGEIALHVGFNDINYFSRKFKSVTGITPTEYKKSFTA